MTMNTFVNALSMSRLHPDSFQAPFKVDLDRIGVGTIVKICNHFERFWCVVVSVNDAGFITATVNNRLLGKYGYNVGDLLMFHKDNVYCIWD
jgi:hypothetical protein